MIAAAHETVEQMKGALQRTLTALDPYIFPLTVKRDLDAY